VVKKSVDLASAQLLKDEPGMKLIFRLPALLRPSSHEEGEKMLRAIEKTYANIFNKEWAGVKRLSFSSTNPTVIMTTKRAVRTLEDTKGLQLRAPEATMADIIRAIGATPVFTPISEWIVSLDKGTVDGGITTTITVQDFKLEKYIRHINMWTVGTSFEFVVMNKERFDSLPSHLQKVLEETSTVLEKNIADARGKTEKEVEEYCRKHGVQFIYPSPAELSKYQEKTMPVYEKIIKELDAQGYPGREVHRFCMEMK
jgi:TRAP-type C4-dicarboxylate transport system substrate-binding protein